jgi:hypothetical protein
LSLFSYCRANKKLKKFAKGHLADYVNVDVDGELKCNVCNKNFKSKALTLEHIEKNHKDKVESDFEGSSSDARVSDESSESEESSGDKSESSDNPSSQDDEYSNDSINLNRKGKIAYSESQETKNGRRLISSYTEFFQNGSKFIAKIQQMTKQQ